MNIKLLQYYAEELSGWDRRIEFQRYESGDLVRKLTMLVSQPVIDSKKGNAFIGQLIVHEQAYEYLKSQIIRQQQRFEKETAKAIDRMEKTFCKEQDMLRSKMHSNEKNFTRIKYGCSFYLFSFLNGSLVESTIGGVRLPLPPEKNYARNTIDALS